MITDFHSHILPGIDDGSPDPAHSLQMLALSAEQGIRRMVATPHFYPNYSTPEAFLEARDRSLRQLQALMTPGLPEIIPGAEIYFFRGISDSEFLPALTIGESRCVMIEMPPAPWPEEFYRELEAIPAKQGLTPIIAHIDRYIRPFRTFSIPERLEELPVLVQANAEFFRNRKTANLALKLLKRDQIHLLGSDCHNLTDRKPDLADAVTVIQTKLGQSPLTQIEELEAEIFNCRVGS